MAERADWLPLPLVGRGDELTTGRRGLEDAAAGKCSLVILAGGHGVGKTRLLEAIAADARARNFAIAHGRAFATDANVPYALIADALTPLVRSLDAAALKVLARGAEVELAHIVPAIDSGVGPATGERSRVSPADAGGDLTTRLRWHFAQFIARFTSRHPLLLAIDNGHWADPSSVALLQFTLRHAADARLLIVATYNPIEADANSPFRSVRRSMATSGVSRELTLEPLSEADVHDLLVRAFGTSATTVRDFAARLFARTLGNPFFVEEMLKSLVERGTLRYVDGRWVGWSVEDFELPATVRDVVLARLETLSSGARQVADAAATFGAQARLEFLEQAAGLPRADLVVALEELRERHITGELENAGEIAYQFTHPLLQRTVYDEIGMARRRELHARVAHVMEDALGDAADRHATELSYHFVRAGTSALAPKSFRYLSLAGRDALAKHADREAAAYLQHAVDLADRHASVVPDDDAMAELLEDVARARQRITEYDAARILWLRARTLRASRGDDVGLARVERRLGLLTYWSGQVDQSLAHYDAALDCARRAGRTDIEVQTLVSKGIALANLGRQDDAKAVVHQALAIVEASGDAGSLARVERALTLLYGYTGPARTAIEFGHRALAHAEQSGDRGVAWSAHWASAVLAGLMANGEAAIEHIRRAEQLARELNSPILAANIAEVAIEYASANGDWAEGLALAEQTIPVARAVASRTLLPRILVWTGSMLLYRDELERAKASFDESWELSRAGAPDAAGRDVHTEIVAHIGQAAYYLATRDWLQAIEYGQRGIAIADRYGIIVWPIHRLLAIVAEAALWSGDFSVTEWAAGRLRRDSPLLEHRLGVMSAVCMDAFLQYFREHDTGAMATLLTAAGDVEGIPYVFQAARLRRNVARLMSIEGDQDGAARELRLAHDTFLRLGAALELRLTREQMRRYGVRPPQQTIVPGGMLTAREREVARLVAQHKTNKEIARVLQISSRTVSTHLSNVFEKLGVDTRGALADVVRKEPGLGG